MGTKETLRIVIEAADRAACYARCAGTETHNVAAAIFEDFINELRGALKVIEQEED